MADPGASKQKKNTLTEKLSKFEDKNPFEYAKAAKESEKFITPSRVEKNDEIEKLWTEFKALHVHVEKHNKRYQDRKEVPADSDFSYKEIHKEMCRCIDSIIEIDPDNYEALRNRASLHKDKGEDEESLKCIEKITNYLKPDDIGAWFDRASLLAIFLRYSEALDCFDKILKIKPEIEGDVLNDKGIVLGKSGDEEGALKCFELALTKPRTVEDYKLWLNKGTAFSGMDEHRKSIECYEKVLELKPDEEFALYNKAMSLHYLGEYPKAVEFFDLTATAISKHMTGKLEEWNFIIMVFRRKGETLLALYPQDQNGTQPALDMFDCGLLAIAKIAKFAVQPSHPDLTSLLMGKAMATQHLEVDEQDRVDVISAALACYAEVLELEPEWGLAWFQMGSIVIELAALGKGDGVWDTATFNFRKAFEFPDTLHERQINFCKAWIKTKPNNNPEDFVRLLRDMMKGKMEEKHPDSDNDSEGK